jgi:hypothetical protein
MTPPWLLIAILQSTQPLSQALALRLYHAAVDLHAQGEARSRLSGDLASGEVRSLGKVLGLGSFTGPAYEAELETATGAIRVQFLVTREGLRVAEADDKPTALPN